jgi:hypothetical protein
VLLVVGGVLSLVIVLSEAPAVVAKVLDRRNWHRKEADPCGSGWNCSSTISMPA